MCHSPWAKRLLGVVFLLVLVATPVASGEPASAVEIEVPRAGKAALRATLHRPKSANGTGVVLAPGQGYHRGLPLMVRAAEGLSAAGFTVLRFDWAYFTAKASPSEDLRAEIEDLDLAIEHLRGQREVERIAGKSLGSLVVLARAAARHDDLVGVALLTLPLIDEEDGLRTRILARLGTFATPTLIVQGDDDPLGPLGALYAVAAKASTPPRVVVVPGDHGFNRARDDTSETDANIGHAVEALVLWFTRFGSDR